MSEAILANQVVKEFGEVRALKGITVGIEKGELFFLLGGSGCGKTTLLRCIAGLESPTSGEIRFDGEDVTSLPTHKREAAMVFQSYALWPHMTVGQNVAFGLEERGISKDEVKRRVGEALEMVRLEGYGVRGIDQMSGGQQQRVSLARALVVRPKVLLLDEPLSNLDARLRVEMRTEIRRIVKENDLTAVYVTHDQEEALSVADRMAVMDFGEVMQVGTPEEVYRRPTSRIVAEFIGETNIFEQGQLGEFRGDGQGQLISVRPEAWRFVDSAAGESNSIAGRVVQTAYLGALVQYEVEVAGGLRLKVAEMNPRVVRQGEVVLRADESDVVLLEK
ncbi:ABC transporter ATP-binding protein [Roseibacillus persicicus]|uniref:ABC transporter ATP-binding protein n=1 Tax=Roseibacillus persicicus TaxID=454148 RepID=UPI002810CF1E|nr:ABC transporter ATP-binding protein [Roseibacillus persicicus]